MSLHAFRQSIGHTTFPPMLSVNIFIGHQPTDIEDHFGFELLLEGERDGGWNMAASVYQLDFVLSDQASSKSYAVRNIKRGRRQRGSLVIMKPVPFNSGAAQLFFERSCCVRA